MLLRSAAFLVMMSAQDVSAPNLLDQTFDEGHGDLSVTQGHKPSAEMQACLSAPTRECAIAASLDTVIKEEMGLERAKVLSALTEAFIDMKDMEQARGILDMALEEARSVGISIALQISLKDIAPLYARVGEADMAFDLALEMQFEVTRDAVFKEMALLFAAKGDFNAMQRALDGITNKDKSFWFQVDALKKTDQPIPLDLLTSITAIVGAFDRYDLQYRGKSALAVLKTKSNDAQGATVLWDELDANFVKISSNSVKAQFAAVKVADMALANLDDKLIDEQLGFAQALASRIKSNGELQMLAGYLGPVEMMRGYEKTAVDRAISFDDVSERLKYYIKLAKVKHTQSLPLIKAINKDLIKILAVDGAYERDGLRYHALRAAYQMKDVALIKRIVEAIEDDDNQARGVALLSAILPVSAIQPTK